jgi:protein phosphatase
MVEFFGVSDVGLVRKQNQDRILIDDSVGLFVVADGMGGHVHGEVAA